VLLVGDAPQIPTNIVEHIPSDIFYGQLVGDDRYLEVLIGRISAEEAAHVQTQVQRTIHYERDLTTADTWLSVAMGFSSGDINGHDGGESDYKHIDSIGKRLSSYGYTVYQEGYEEGFDEVSALINDGVGVIHFCGHGAVGGMEDPHFPGHYVTYELKNANRLPYVFSVACEVGNFTYSGSPCFAEIWMRHTENDQPAGAIATFMPTIFITWSPAMTAQDEFVNICLDLPSPYSGTQPGTKRTFAGAALNATQKMLMVHGETRYVIEDYNSYTVLGDPTLMYRTKTPQAMTVSHLSVFCSEMNSLTVECDAEGAVVAVSYVDNNNEVIILGTAVVADGIAEIHFSETVTTSMTLTVAVTGFNRVTYVSTIGSAGSTSSVTIGNNTVWNSDTNICGSINITNNSTLTISNCTVSLCNNVKIVVEPGSRLIVNNSTLTNVCENQMWQGITVSSGGSVEVKNGGKIENAVCGITVNGGGTVIATDAHFVNNTTGVYFLPRKARKSRSGTFITTTFELNNHYLGNPEDFEAHIKMRSSGSVVVQGCSFSSTAPDGGSSKNIGIDAMNTDLDVREFCPMQYLLWPSGFCSEDEETTTTFTGFSHAISAHNTGSAPKIKVRFGEFEDNLGGIYFEGINYPELIKNDFKIEQPFSFGISARYATGYQIEDNIFEDRDPDLKKVTTGLRINNSGSAENEVYKNMYENLHVAQQFLGKNRFQDNGKSQPLNDIPFISKFTSRSITGLQTLCNEFYNSQSTDILVGSWEDTQYDGNSIRENQGSMQKPAGNRFHDNPPMNIDNTLSQYSINYYYDQYATNVMPNNVSSNVSLIPISYSNGCPSKFTEVAETGQEHALAQYNDLDSDYEMWLDKLLYYNGNDEEALGMVFHYSALKDNLFNSIIVNAFGGHDEKEDQDSITENLRALFYYRGNYMDYLSIMETFLAENKYDEALEILKNMYSQFAVTPEHEMELEGLEIYVEWLQQLEKDDKNIYELSKQELDYLIDYVKYNTGRGVVFANIILCRLYNICIEEQIAPNSEEEMVAGLEDPRESMPSASSACQKTALENITLYPNPTTGELQITNGGLRITNVEVYDIYGRNVGATLVLAQGKINISHLNSGIYFVKITTGAGEVVKKVVKQ
jgi:hypothetical protein